MADFAGAQAPDPLREFEVASIRPNRSNERMYYGIKNGSLTVRNMTVKGLIQVAYGKRDFQISGGPGWIASEFFDIDAKAERPLKASHDMEKALLESRFQLKFHKVTRETSIYSLVVARGGLRMKLSADQSEPEKGGPKESGPRRIVGEGVPMYVIANLLSNMTGRSVVNNTGLTGKYDVRLETVADSLQDDATESDLVGAVEKQLGLRLESIRGPEEVLVIDQIERPSAN